MAPSTMPLRNRREPSTETPHPSIPSPLPPLRHAPAPSASDAEWAAFHAAGRARRRVTAVAVLVRSLAVPPPELLRWDGTPYPDLTTDPLYEPEPTEDDAR